ncbi:FkbM family methyltransferase [Bradyrhizobium sp. JYMT SZCCT0428]|uniref:FkbM family methyltransferase n=1 Tax=Bradyrhizobium sp. JYMT SZCCT0428 TaxID=2807673 RepID=UPI001BA6FB33|nr:FkbM family methyltransferase [Bradyrhizobium sp. JYMT SZCCT0428]MBR1153732.1 FkbM family methyltransferase [Bradyrhizobium sp. JYMT SZCCT0428]
MRNPNRKIAFILASTDHGTFIINRLDYHMLDQTSGYGVGFEILEKGCFQSAEIDSTLQLLDLRRKHHGDGVVAIDCGANVGTHTIEWAKRMTGWGSVLAIEAQERIFYALAGNLAINNCFNARAILAAVGNQVGEMMTPVPNYLVPGSFGSLELKNLDKPEFIGQQVDRSGSNLATVRTLSIDSMKLPRIDFIKIDVEGMELEVLEGATQSIANSFPIMLIEAIKVDQDQLRIVLERSGYRVFKMAQNFLAIHSSDRAASQISTRA